MTDLEDREFDIFDTWDNIIDTARMSQEKGTVSKDLEYIETCVAELKELMALKAAAQLRLLQEESYDETIKKTVKDADLFAAIGKLEVELIKLCNRVAALEHPLYTAPPANPYSPHPGFPWVPPYPVTPYVYSNTSSSYNPDENKK
jgi:hypothetical protein